MIKYGDMMRDSFVYMIENNEDKLSISDLAERFSYNAKYYGYLFASFFNITLEKLMRQEQLVQEDCKKFERKIDYSLIHEEYKYVEQFIITGSEIGIKEGEEEKIYFKTKEIFCKNENEIIVDKSYFPKSHNRDVIAVWWNDGQYNLHYLIGNVAETGQLLQEKEIKIIFPAANYLILSTNRENDSKQIDETIKMLIKYAFLEGEDNNKVTFDAARYHFICYHKGKIFIYIPLVVDNVKIENKRIQYHIDEWIRYIDKHVKENLTPQKLAKVFGYSSQHFRYVFRIYYNMTVSDYIRKRKLQMAAQEIQMGSRLLEVAQNYGFSSYQGFAKAFRKEFFVSPKKYEKIQFEIVDLNQYYKEYKDKLKLSIINMKELKMIGHTVIPDRGQEVDIPAQVCYWLDRDFPCLKNTRFSYNKIQREDKIAMWYHDAQQTGEEINIEYILGPVVDSFEEDIPENMVQVTIKGGNYAIFETDKECDRNNLGETIRMFSRCVFFGWIKENRERIDFFRFTFERYINDKVYIYVPILK